MDRDTNVPVRRPGECRYFVDPGCEVDLVEPPLTPEMIEVPLDRPPIDFAGVLIGSPTTSHSTGRSAGPGHRARTPAASEAGA